MTIRAYSDSGCADQIASATLDMPATSLSASGGDDEVSFTLSNYALSWWFTLDNQYQSCVYVPGDTFSIITYPDPTPYNAKAYRNQHDCLYDQNRLGQTTFTYTNP